MVSTSSSAIPDTLITTYLEMTSEVQFKPAFSQNDSIHILPLKQADVPFYRFMYREVGERWRWRDRLELSDEDLRQIITQPGVTIDMLYFKGSPAGFVELASSDGSVEVAYFGLREPFFGRGLGKHLLSYGVRRAWAHGADRIWLHTCNLDGPHALANYQKRGFSIYMERSQPMPDRYR